MFILSLSRMFFLLFNKKIPSQVTRYHLFRTHGRVNYKCDVHLQRRPLLLSPEVHRLCLHAFIFSSMLVSKIISTPNLREIALQIRSKRNNGFFNFLSLINSNNFPYLLSTAPVIESLWTRILASSMVCFTIEAAGWSLANRSPWPAQSDIYSGLFAFAAA